MLDIYYTGCYYAGYVLYWMLLCCVLIILDVIMLDIYYTGCYYAGYVLYWMLLYWICIDVCCSSVCVGGTSTSFTPLPGCTTMGLWLTTQNRSASHVKSPQSCQQPYKNYHNSVSNHKNYHNSVDSLIKLSQFCQQTHKNDHNPASKLDAPSSPSPS